jgi:apolipoprotein N-acyltransferase
VTQRKYALAFIAGALSALGFAPLELWPLAVLAIAAMIHFNADAGRPWRSFWYGWHFGLGHFMVGLNWLAHAFQYQHGVPAWTGWLAVPLLAAYLAIFPAAAIAAASKIAPRGGFLQTIALASTWMLLEWTRSWLFTGFAWNPLGIIWIDVVPVALLARYVGGLGLSSLTIILAGLLLLAVKGRRLPVVIAVAALIIALTIPRASPRADAVPGGAKVRIVQPNIGQGEKWAPELSKSHRQRLMALSGKASKDGAPRMIFWPEAAVTEDLERATEVRRELATMLGARDLLLTGATSLTRERKGDPVTATNSMFAINATGQIVARYDKAHLVPFGEYVPSFAKWLGFSQFVEGEIGFASGPGPRSLDLPSLPVVGVSICYEITFPGRVVSTGERPDFIFNPSNDAWFGSWGPPQHLAQARLRAIEEGLPVIRSTPTGISAMIRPDGSLVAALPLDRAGYIEATLPPADQPTPFSRWVNSMPLALASILALFGVWLGRRRCGRKESSLPLRDAVGRISGASL